MKTRTFPSTKTDILVGPLRSFVPLETIYQPVDCDFTDELEYISVHCIDVEVQYWTDAILASIEGLIVDILTENKEEFLVLADGVRIRLDRIYVLRIIDDGDSCTESGCVVGDQK